MKSRVSWSASSLSKIPALWVLAFVALSGGCSPFKHVSDVSKLKNHQRVIIGSITLEDGKLSDWVDGLGGVGHVRFNERLYLDIRDRFHGESARGAAPLADTGGIFRVSVAKNRMTFLIDVYVLSTYIVANLNTTLPMLFKLPPSANTCDYVGTFVMRKEGDRIVTEVFDTYDRDKAMLASHVKGCDLKKTMAVKVTDAELAAVLAFLTRK
jgi:hypothetical protein